MLSYTKLRNSFGSLSQNTATANLALFDTLANNEHRYLLQKYFSNETNYSITTYGTQDLTLTGSLSAGATSATLTSAWSYYTTRVLVTFSSGDMRFCKVVKDSATITWDAPLTDTATTAITVGTQYYPLPPNYSKMKTLTVTVGNLQWTPKEILTTEEWNNLNVFPYYSDIPVYFFIYPGGDHGAQVGIWPIPSTTGNLITYNYKFRVPDLSIADYTTPGTLSIATGGVAITGTGSSFTPTVNQQLESRWIKFDQPAGDNLWYQIYTINSTTSASLYQPYQGNAITGATGGTYTIGQMPLLMEDFHDMLLYKPLYIYFSTINKDTEKAKNFKELYDERLRMLEEYSGNNSINVNLGRKKPGQNPNLFVQDIGSSS